MGTQIITTTFQLRRGNAAWYVENNPVLAQGEPAFELDTKRLKIGDGTTSYNNLPYFESDIQIKNVEFNANTLTLTITPVVGNVISYNLTNYLDNHYAQINPDGSLIVTGDSVIYGKLQVGNIANADGSTAIANGSFSQASGDNSQAQGYGVAAYNEAAHAEGINPDDSNLGEPITKINITVEDGEDEEEEHYLLITPQECLTDNIEGFIYYSTDSFIGQGYYLYTKKDPSTDLILESDVPIKIYENELVYIHDSYKNYEETGEWDYPEDTIIFSSTALGKGSHSEGFMNLAANDFSHAEGYKNIAAGEGSHAEGNTTVASGNYSHAEGNAVIASGIGSHAEGYQTKAYSNYSHAEGLGTQTSAMYQHVSGKYNKDNANALFIVGNGTDANHKLNALEVMSDGTTNVKNLNSNNVIIVGDEDGVTISNDGTVTANEIYTTGIQCGDYSFSEQDGLSFTDGDNLNTMGYTGIHIGYVDQNSEEDPMPEITTFKAGTYTGIEKGHVTNEVILALDDSTGDLLNDTIKKITLNVDAGTTWADIVSDARLNPLIDITYNGTTAYQRLFKIDSENNYVLASANIELGEYGWYWPVVGYLVNTDEAPFINIYSSDTIKFKNEITHYGAIGD